MRILMSNKFFTAAAFIVILSITLAMFHAADKKAALTGKKLSEEIDTLSGILSENAAANRILLRETAAISGAMNASGSEYEKYAGDMGNAARLLGRAAALNESALSELKRSGSALKSVSSGAPSDAGEAYVRLSSAGKYLTRAREEKQLALRLLADASASLGGGIPGAGLFAKEFQETEDSVKKLEESISRIQDELDEHMRIITARESACRELAAAAAAAEIEAAKADAAKADAERIEAARIEASRIEAARIEAARIEAERLEAARAEKVRIEAAKADAERKAAVSGTSQETGILEIADFNSGRAKNNLGGEFGVWDSDPNDITQSCIMSFEPVTRDGTRGNSLKLIYDVNSLNPAYNGFWMHLSGADLTPYEFIFLSIKGDPVAGFTEQFKIELKDSGRNSESLMLKGITGRWQEKRIPLVYFETLDMTSLSEFVIVFEDTVSDPKSGILYIDKIYAE